jgi:CspA family cold shock protein
MSDQIRTIVCQRCGIGFTLTENYLEWLTRRGARIVVPVLCTTCFMKAGPWPKQQGQVKWFNSRKHYGFIVAKEGEEVFFHQRQIVADNQGDAREGQMARFHIRQSQKGPEAVNVELIKE